MSDSIIVAIIYSLGLIISSLVASCVALYGLKKKKSINRLLRELLMVKQDLVYMNIVEEIWSDSNKNGKKTKRKVREIATEKLNYKRTIYSEPARLDVRIKQIESIIPQQAQSLSDDTK